MTAPSTLEAIDRLLDEYTDAQVAEQLNQQGYRTFDGLLFESMHVCQLLSSTFLRTILTHRRPQSAQPIGSVTSVHFSETCDEDLPRLITQVTTTIAPIPDRHALPAMHEVLEQREILPEQHLVDAGYIDAEALVAAQTTRSG